MCAQPLKLALLPPQLQHWFVACPSGDQVHESRGIHVATFSITKGREEGLQGMAGKPACHSAALGGLAQPLRGHVRMFALAKGMRGWMWERLCRGQR